MYGGFYTRQEQEDALTSRIDNPNRVGSGFINFGAMERQQTPAANWQTGNLIGGGAAAATPSQVSDIWNSTPGPPPPPQPQVQQQQMRLPPQVPQQQQMSVQQQLAQQPFAPPAMQPNVSSACALFQSLGIDSTAPQQLRKEPTFPGAPFGGMNDVSAMSAAAQQQPPPGPPSQSLMNLLQTPAPTANQLSAAFQQLPPQQACAARAQAAFSNPIPAAPQCQALHNGVHSAAFSAGAFAAPPPPPMVQQQPPAGAAHGGMPPPRTVIPNSASDYAVAAVNYKPPPQPRVAASMGVSSISRKPEASTKTSAPPPPKEEWECPRCTFLNNSALRECEMCGFARPGAHSARESNADDEGWRTASSTTVRKAAPVPSSDSTGKSKTQNKNEKRRAKKRGD